MDGAIHTISLMIGELKGEVKALRESSDSLNRIWGEREAGAQDGRRQVHLEINEMRMDLNHVQAQVENFGRDLNEIKPVIADLKTERSEQIGARRLGWKLWAALTAAAGSIGYIVHEVFNTMPGARH